MNETTWSLEKPLDVSILLKIASRETQIAIDESTRERVEASAEVLRTRLDQNEPIYGVTTGFGPLVNHTVDADKRGALQLNLLQQLSCNVGPALPSDVVRAIMAVRARALSQGRSGVRMRVLRSLVDFVNSGATPVIRRFGSVGASGDLVPLASLARCMSGWDTIRLPDGRVVDNSPSLIGELGIAPFSPQPKEALALVNGTSFSAGIAALTSARVATAFRTTVLPIVATAIALLDGGAQHLAASVYEVKAHESAATTARELRTLLDRDDPGSDPGLPQPPYSTRSAVLWYGAAWEQIESAQKTLETELNCVDDNPLVLAETGRLLHAANFQGTYVGLAADTLSAAIARTSIGVERLINRVLHDAHNGTLPAFLAGEPVGTNSGLQGYQLLATSLTADIRTRAVNHSLSSIPTNGDNQDIVSMSANSALNALELGDRFSHLCAVAECIFARAVQLSRSIERAPTLPMTLSRHWDSRRELLEADYISGELAQLVDDRHMSIWNGQPV